MDIDRVMTFDTRGGNVRYVLKDTDGNEYTTFREAIGKEAKRLEGRRARIEYHENQRGEYTNVYLDKVEPAPEEPGEGAAGRDTDPDEAAWRTAVEAAPGSPVSRGPGRRSLPRSSTTSSSRSRTAWRRTSRTPRPRAPTRASGASALTVR